MRNFLFLSTAWFFFLPISVSPAAPDFIISHTYTTPIDLEPVSFADLKNSYQTAGVCFLGFGDCMEDAGFGRGSDDYSLGYGLSMQKRGICSQQLQFRSIPQRLLPV